jgi:hypothetical protein
MLDMAGQASARDARGRFVPGQSGNPSGKAPGTRNRATLLRAALDSEEGPAMARIIIDKALAGDVVTAKFCISRLEPKPRSLGIEIDLPEGARARDIVAGFDATMRAMAKGEITPEEALQVTRVLDGRRKAIEAAAREAERKARADEELFVGAGFYPARAGTEFPPSPTASEKPCETRAGQSPAPTNKRRPIRDVLRASEGMRATLLHSTCISRSPPPAWLAAAAPCGVFRAEVQRV